MTPKGEMPRDNYLDPISNHCPPGASIDKEVETFPIESYPESARDKHNGNHYPKITQKLLMSELSGHKGMSGTIPEICYFCAHSLSSLLQLNKDDLFILIMYILGACKSYLSCQRVGIP